MATSITHYRGIYSNLNLVSESNGSRTLTTLYTVPAGKRAKLIFNTPGVGNSTVGFDNITFQTYSYNFLASYGTVSGNALQVQLNRQITTSIHLSIEIVLSGKSVFSTGRINLTTSNEIRGGFVYHRASEIPNKLLVPNVTTNSGSTAAALGYPGFNNYLSLSEYYREKSRESTDPSYTSTYDGYKWVGKKVILVDDTYIMSSGEALSVNLVGANGLNNLNSTYDNFQYLYDFTVIEEDI